MNRKFIFIITYGRSGSTLLMGILNSISDCCIKGENYLAEKSLLDFTKRMLSSCQMRNTFEGEKIDSSKNAWWWNFSNNDLKQGLRSLIFRLIDPSLKHEYIGHKTIRGYKLQRNNLYQLLNFIEEFFDAKFIFLTRDLNEVLNSGMWKDRNKKKSRSSLERFEENINHYIRKYPQQDWLYLTYEELINGEVGSLEDFLEVNIEDRKLETVLHTHYGPLYDFNSNTDHTFLDILDSDSTVLDLGAGKGNFSDYISKEYTEDIHLVEANPNLIPKLKEKYSRVYNYLVKYNPEEKKGNFYICPSDFESSSEFRNLSNHDKEKTSVDTIDFFDFIENFEKIDLLKMDIEGSEWDILKNFTKEEYNKIDQISVEFHHFLNPKYSKLTNQCISNLKNLGYELRIFGREDYLFYKKQLK